MIDFCKAKTLDSLKQVDIILIMTDSAKDDNDILKRRVHFNLLYDFYSPLLTERQRKVYETLCFSDLTLSEAADVLGISRQAVYTLARNVMGKLDGLERDLHFAANTRHLEERIRELESENEALRVKSGAKEENESCLTL